MGLAADAALKCGYAAARLERIYAASSKIDTRMLVQIPKDRDPNALSTCLGAWFDAHPEFEFETLVEVRDD